MKKILCAGVVALSVLFVTGCGESVEDVHKKAEFVKVCKDSGGDIAYDGFNGMHCWFR
jgi:hypothetical protein